MPQRKAIFPVKISQHINRKKGTYMQEITTLAENLFVFLFIIIIGFLIGYKKYVSKEFKDDLTFLLLKVTLPAMIFNAIARHSMTT
ncbi:MAG: hypothetical protein FWJ66_12855 [Caldibacillus sp.]